jgi:hypothetical protein
MAQQTRRTFMSDSARKMMLGTLGAGVIADLQLAPVFGDDLDASVSFGEFEPLVAMLQETPLEKLQPILVKKIQQGTKLQTLISAGSLANARTFGGEDYIGFHTMMALGPAWQMAQELPEKSKPLPVLKVLYRNTKRIHETGGRATEKLKTIDNVKLPEGTQVGPYLRDAVRTGKFDKAEEAFSALKNVSHEEAWNGLLYALYDQPGVHKVVQAWRTWDMHHLTGEEHAHTLLRASIRHLTRDESFNIRDKRQPQSIRKVLPALFDQYGFEKRKLGTKRGDDQWVQELAGAIFAGTREQAAEAAAQALAAGYRIDNVAEAISLAANLLLLHDAGRKEARGEEKPIGSVHGDSVGVHASDSANAWRNIARVSNYRNKFASLIVGAYHTAGQSRRVTKDIWPKAEHRQRFTSNDPKRLLQQAEDCIRNKDQGGACAAVQRYADSGNKARPVFDLMIQFATSEDGALHAEKYYRTVSEEFAVIRPSLRWRQLVALARVSASECGTPAGGSKQARELLGLG